MMLIATTSTARSEAIIIMATRLVGKKDTIHAAAIVVEQINEEAADMAGMPLFLVVG